MASSPTVPAVARQLLALVLAGIGAQAAWSAGYYASFAICALVALWAAGSLVMVRRSAAPEPAANRQWASEVLEREREIRTLAAFLDHAPVPLLALKPPQTLSALNLAARRFFGVDDVVPDPPEALMAAVRGAAPGERRTVTLEPEGSPRAFALTLAELVSEGDFVRIVALTDIQAEIQAAEAAALRELIQVLSHEIMNSLTPVTSLAHTAAEILRAEDGGASIAQAREAAEGVARRSEGLLRFIEAYRELARLPEPRFADVNVRRFLDELALLFRSRWGAEGVELEFEPPPGDWAVELDADLMGQALINVLANAAEAALAGGRPPKVRLAARPRRGGRLAIEVADNGPGVDQPDPSVIFRPFFTTKPQGTGVGLSLARQIVLAHGGEIAVGAAEAGGATITISL